MSHTKIDLKISFTLQQLDVYLHIYVSNSQYTDGSCRKSQAKKVVCIPAPAAMNSRSSGEVVPSDLWAWRKYGQKPIKGSPYPRYIFTHMCLYNPMSVTPFLHINQKHEIYIDIKYKYVLSIGMFSNKLDITILYYKRIYNIYVMLKK